MARLDLSVPKAWHELSQEQLAFLLRTIASVNRANNGRPFRSAEDFAAFSSAQVATYCLLRWNGLSIVTPYGDNWLVGHEGKEYIVSAADLTAATSFLSWINELPDAPVRLDRVDGAEAVDASLNDGFSFDDWLSCEALWQGYQVTTNNEFLRRMAEILYRKPGIKPAEHEILGIFYWWAGVKTECNRLYPHFFQPAAPGASAELTQDMARRNMDAQIRALTKGDITKEEQILAMPAHRALTELDALAREYEDLNRKYGSK